MDLIDAVTLERQYIADLTELLNEMCAPGNGDKPGVTFCRNAAGLAVIADTIKQKADRMADGARQLFQLVSDADADAEEGTPGAAARRAAFAAKIARACRGSR